MQVHLTPDQKAFARRARLKLSITTKGGFTRKVMEGKKTNALGAKWGWNIHPGEILREEFLKPMGLSVYQLARHIHLTRSRVNDIVLERRAVTADTALRLARFFGTTPQFWMNMQASYELRKAENELGPKLSSIEPAGRLVA
jgi:antitoxin HigA-1